MSRSISTTMVMTVVVAVCLTMAMAMTESMGVAMATVRAKELGSNRLHKEDQKKPWKKDQDIK